MHYGLLMKSQSLSDVFVIGLLGFWAFGFGACVVGGDLLRSNSFRYLRNNIVRRRDVLFPLHTDRCFQFDGGGAVAAFLVAVDGVVDVFGEGFFVGGHEDVAALVFLAVAIHEIVGDGAYVGRFLYRYLW